MLTLQLGTRRSRCRVISIVLAALGIIVNDVGEHARLVRLEL